jgi:hypothetical protein
MGYFVGVELGQLSQVTAISVVESQVWKIKRTEAVRRDSWVDYGPVYEAPDGTETRVHPPVNFALRHAERLGVGTPYADTVTKVEAICRKLQNPTIVLDATGVGKAVIDLFTPLQFSKITVLLTTGDQVTSEFSRYKVPKRDAISTTQVLLESGRLKFAKRIPHAKLLARELVNFRLNVTKPSSNDIPDWREGPEDDLVFSLAIAVWQAERNPGLGLSFGCGVPEFGGWPLRAWGESGGVF